MPKRSPGGEGKHIPPEVKQIKPPLEPQGGVEALNRFAESFPSNHDTTAAGESNIHELGLLANKARLGNEAESFQAVSTLLSRREELQNRIIGEGMDANGANVLQALLEKATDEQRDGVRELFRDIIRSPNLDTKKFFAFMSPYDKEEIVASFGQRYMRMILESVGLPESLIPLWERSRKGKIFGLIVNLERLIEIEKARPTGAEQLYSQFGIRFFGRYALPDLLRQIDETDTQQPYGIWLRPGVEDIRGVFYADDKKIEHAGMKLRSATDDPIGQRIIEASNKEEVCARIRSAHARYGAKNRFSFAIISGHGNEGLLQVGEGESADSYDSRDVTRRHFKAGKRYFKKGATIILQSCRTGIRLARKLSFAYPDTFVYAPLSATNLGRLDVLGDGKTAPLLRPTYFYGDLWALYRGGTLIDFQEQGSDGDTLTPEKGEEINEVYNALGGARRRRHRKLRRIEQQLFTRRMQTYCRLLTHTRLVKGSESLREIWPYMNTMGDAAAVYLPALRKTVSNLLEQHLNEFSDEIEKNRGDNMDTEEALNSLEYFVSCADEKKREKGMAILDRYWDTIEKLVLHSNSSGLMAGRYLATQIEYGGVEGKKKAGMILKKRLATMSQANHALSEYFPVSESMQFLASLTASFFNLDSPKVRVAAHELMRDMFTGFTEQDLDMLTDAWFNAAGTDHDRLFMINYHLRMMAMLESRSSGSAHALFTDYGIRNFGSYPFEVLRNQYIQRSETGSPYALLLYPRQSLITENGEHHHYLKLWSELALTIGRKGIRMRVVEWENEHDIANAIGKDEQSVKRPMLAIIGGRGNSQGLYFQQDGTWRALSKDTLRRRPTTREALAGLRGKTVILDVNCAGKPDGFAQELSRRLECTAHAAQELACTGTRVVAHIDSIQPRLFRPDRIDIDVKFGAGDTGAYQVGQRINDT